MKTSDVTRKLLVENDRVVIARDPNNVSQRHHICNGRPPGRISFNAHNVASRIFIFIAKSKTWKKEMTNILRQYVNIYKIQ